MSQFMHNAIAFILWQLTWHCILKRHPIMKENLKEWEKWFQDKIFK
ncbi:hypothetical protein [Candidatus Babela massiliensis]|uniref:Uncharacterized protein n=1 Tax=Candidatus Babela massiliensis TaxID=673862 RepID=V6DIR5_9BACT|nr:hypothetical protein [Candidatus Babela massiliensis]CDK30421.1 hypothetical protein BABL1_gene_596 [Candidatus Babela massiliensis]